VNNERNEEMFHIRPLLANRTPLSALLRAILKLKDLSFCVMSKWVKPNNLKKTF